VSNTVRLHDFIQNALDRATFGMRKKQLLEFGSPERIWIGARQYWLYLIQELGKISRDISWKVIRYRIERKSTV